jgi:hypothetical protein
MNECWIIGSDGRGVRRDVQRPDLTQLQRDEYVEYRIEHHSGDGSEKRTAHIYAHPAFKPTEKEMFAASEGLFGPGGSNHLWGPQGQIW